MRKVIASLMAFLIVLSGCSSVETQADKVKVVASFYPLAEFASTIGGDYVEVINLVPTGEEVHGFELTPKNRADIESAQLFVYNGLGLESWIEDISATLDQTTLVDSSVGVSALKASEDHDHEEEEHDDHDHGEYDPHIWLSVVNAKIQAENIYKGLIQVDADHQDYYKTNYDALIKQLDTLDQEFEDGLSQLSTRVFVTSHQAFAYLAHDYQLEQVAISGINDDSEPDPQTMIEIIEFIKTHQLKYIFVGEQVSSKVSEQIASETQTQIRQLYTIEGLSEAQVQANDNYFSLMRANLAVLIEALS